MVPVRAGVSEDVEDLTPSAASGERAFGWESVTCRKRPGWPAPFWPRVRTQRGDACLSGQEGRGLDPELRRVSAPDLQDLTQL